MKNSVILIIDPQCDFTQPTGSLFVNGAVEDMQRIAAFINKKSEELDEIVVSLDWHQPFSIFHPSFWKDSKDNSPAAFTLITLKDVKEGKWLPKVAPVTVESYLQELESSGQFAHVVWPEHCIAGTQGAAIDPVIADAIKNWSRTGKEFHTILKGTSIFAENFGVFKAQVTIPGIPETDWNLEEINALGKYDTIYIAGEAKSHCVAQTVNQLFEFPEIRKKLVILEDCMSNVTGFETIADPIWNLAKDLKVTFAKSTEL